MELKEFVKKAICEISTAIKEADEEIKGVGGLVNPGDKHPSAPSLILAPRTRLDFDIAVSVAKEAGGGGGLSGTIVVAEFFAGGKGGVKSENSSRLTFSIDVVFPFDPNQGDRVKHVARP